MVEIYNKINNGDESNIIGTVSDNIFLGVTVK